MSGELERSGKDLYGAIRQVLQSARQTAYKAVNFAMVQAYWQVGRLIVEDEQKGKARAEYGKKVLDDLAERLTAEFGKGFEATNHYAYTTNELKEKLVNLAWIRSKRK